MRSSTKIVLVLGVAMVLVVAYMSIIGTSKPVDDIDAPAEDPTGAERLPIAYGNFFVSVGIDNVIGGYNAVLQDFEANVYLSDGTQQLAVYVSEKWDVLGFLTADDVKVTLKGALAGPNNFAASWNPDSVMISVGEWGYEWVDFQSANINYYDAGTYKMTLQVFVEGDEFTGLAESDSFVFEV